MRAVAYEYAGSDRHDDRDAGGDGYKDGNCYKYRAHSPEPKFYGYKDFNCYADIYNYFFKYINSHPEQDCHSDFNRDKDIYCDFYKNNRACNFHRHAYLHDYACA